MESRAKLLGHPIHQMLIVFPLGLLTASVAFDLAYAAAGNTDFSTVSFWTLGVGLAGGALAAVFGFADWMAIPSRTRAKRVGAVHGGVNAVALIMFLQSFIVRYATPQEPPEFSIVVSSVAVVLVAVGGWLGGELVDRLGVGVDDGANLDAPSSLRERRIGPEGP